MRRKSCRKIISGMLALTLLFSLGGSNMMVKAENADVQDMKKLELQSDILGSSDGFLLADKNGAASLYVDTAHEETSSSGSNSYCGLEIIGETFAGDVEMVTGSKPELVNDSGSMSGNVVIAGTIGGNEVIDNLIAKGKIDASGLYKDGALKWDCYQMQFLSGADMAACGYSGVSQALVITGSNKRGAMYGLFNISEHIGVSAWVYMADAVPVKYSAVYLNASMLEFNQADKYQANEPSVKYRGIFINDESPSFTGWAGTKFSGVNEKCYQHIFELLIRMKANYLWPAMWGNSFSDEGSAFKLANVVMADAYGVCMGTSHHEACCRAGVEWQRIYRNYGSSNAWNYTTNANALHKFWADGIERNGAYENTITMGMRGEGDSAIKGTVEENINLLKDIITDQLGIINDYTDKNPNSKTKDALKIYIPYSENEEYYYGPDDGSLEGLNVWDQMDDVTIMLTDDNYGNVRSLPEESIRNRKAGWGMYYHLDGHVGTGAYEWVSSTQLEHIWDQLTMTYDYNVRNIWVVNVGDIKPLEMELNYAMDLAYDMDKWGKENTAELYRKQWLQTQLGGKANCSDEVAAGVADCVADFLKISTYRKAEYVTSSLYSNKDYNEAQKVLDLCLETIDEANYYYDNYFKGTAWDDAFYQIVYYQAVGTANVTRMQIFKSLNDFYKGQKSSLANVYADLVDEGVEYDKELTDYYNNTMTGGKWKKMMSSPHVGFKSWNSDGWSYPSGSKITLGSEAKMLVSPEGDDKAYETGIAVLKDFTNTQKQRYCVTLSNGGTAGYDFTVGTLADWIKITDKNGDNIVNGGNVTNAAYFYISIDWTKVRSDKTGTVVIKGAGETVKLTVNTNYTEYKSKGVGTHFESNNVVSIDAADFATKKDSENGVSWGKINGYGRYDSAMKMFPTTTSFTEATGDTHDVTSGGVTRTVTEYNEPVGAPYMEYKVYVNEDGEYTFTAYTTTTNNIFKPSGWGYVPVELFYGIQVDDGNIQMINSLPDGKYISFAADGNNQWIQGIKNNIHVSTSIENMSEGIHTVRFYGMHAGLGLERLVISDQPLASSYLGPQETFMLDYEIIPEQKNGVHYEAAAGKLSFGEPSDLAAITDTSDKNDKADPVEEETAIPRPYVPTPAPTKIPEVDAGNSATAAPITISTVQPTATPAPKAVVINKKLTDSLSTSKIYKVGKFRYKITRLAEKGGKVSLVSTVSKKIKSAVIPAKIKINKVSFAVTSITKKAFNGCSKLRMITVKTKKLTKVGINAFKGIAKKAQVKVPKSSLTKYKKLFRNKGQVLIVKKA